MEAVVLDNGITRLRDKAKVNIYITDVNDNPPKFMRKPYRAQVPEEAPISTNIIRISASDADEGLNGDVVYTIVDGNEDGRFKVDETNRAADLGNPVGLTATATLTVDVLDANDNAPEFTQSESEISIVETTEINTVLVQFQATDADLGVNKEVSFMIGGGNMQEAFRIDTKTGTLYLERPLDFEEQSLYRLNITAADGGSPRLTTTTTTPPPAFPNTAIWRRIDENIRPNSPVVTVTAEDPDSGRMARSNTPSRAKSLPESTLPSTRTPARSRRSKALTANFSDTFRLTVVATDQAEPKSARLQAEKLVTVIVEDINDKPPQFVSMNAGILKEDSPAGTEIMRVSARDLDANPNGLVTYEMVAGNKDIFRLDRVTGALKLIQK
ncbi:fat protein [Penaeus vannamei]|uniref:Fat protein n=1 Tax=Penaeus vannamei TaxID=6689 RepID=A0A3R7QX94_PENVA|nr:fat protein [Penaeus vannamei]